MEDEEEMEELSFVPSAVSEPRWALHICDNKCREKGFTFFQVAAIVSQEGGAAHTINLSKQCYNERRLKPGEEEVTASKWRALVGQRAFRRKLWAAFWYGTFLAQDVGTFHHQKSVDQIVPGRCRQATWNGRQEATRDAVHGGARACAAQQ